MTQGTLAKCPLPTLTKGTLVKDPLPAVTKALLRKAPACVESCSQVSSIYPAFLSLNDLVCFSAPVAPPWPEIPSAKIFPIIDPFCNPSPLSFKFPIKTPFLNRMTPPYL
ncbi:hypothetical protein V6Z12_A02G093800 [Gossypium hirsutum]